MTAVELAELRRLLDAASPRPWDEVGDELADDSENHVAIVEDDDDRALIVAAVNALPRLLAEVERLRAEVERLRAFILAEARDNAVDFWQDDKKRIDAEVDDALVRAGIGKETKP